MADTQALIRIGKLSTVDYQSGQARVVYEDRDNSVTVQIPMMLMEDTGLMRAGDSVLVAHLANGTAKGVIIGRYHTDNVNPVNGKADLFHKEMSRTELEAYHEYAEQKYTIKVPHMFVMTDEGNIELVPKIKELEQKIEKMEKIAENHEKRISALGG